MVPFDEAPQGGSTVPDQGAGRTLHTLDLLAFPPMVGEVHPTDIGTSDLLLAEMGYPFRAGQLGVGQVR
jgi:hypothetical protein